MAETTVFWEFDLYIAGQSPKTQCTYDHLKKICTEHLHGNCTINVFNLLLNPQLAIDNQITATPTTVRRHPLPEKILIGDLSNESRVVLTLGLK